MVYLFLAEGFEEVEALTPLDYLRRAGVEVCSVGVTGQIVTGSHGIMVHTDITPDQVNFDQIEMIVLPGGMPGTLNLEKNQIVQQAIDVCTANHHIIGAICAAPSILGHKGLLQGKKATCFPGFEPDLIGANYQNQPVCVDDTIITSRGAGAAQQFSFALVEQLLGKEKAEILAQQVQW
ncbi:DJ-1 family glyoxalase III [Massilioclostridium coli]|uniref:DJ-1 family glyoxalase III n=1 Tax=Massilioclostridium coli TaxID=1870991 RepID=UPI0022E50A8D|nr:DJ-1 family glyoxalase III [Massilioclostridium coli]